MSLPPSLQDQIRSEFERRGVLPLAVNVRTFPGETIVIVEVSHSEDRAREIARELDSLVASGFITVRLMESGHARSEESENVTVHSDTVTRLIELVYARARASEVQPSIQYVPDVAERLKLALSPRHTLIFGRRGVGKTALMLEARRKVEERGDLAIWVNMQSLRTLGTTRAFLTIAQRLCRSAGSPALRQDYEDGSQSALGRISERIETLLGTPSDSDQVALLIASIQEQLSAFSLVAQKSIFLFLDDLHYLPSDAVPSLLDMLHAVSRDTRLWIKAAAIKHQTRWFSPESHTGLQTGHDAILVDLDVTLEEPSKAKSFLKSVLEGFASKAGAQRLSAFLAGPALDRLVLASGGVPRDFLTLCADAIQFARRRPNARAAGVQDVNNAAGQAAKIKQQELEEDAASQKGRSDELVQALGRIRKFLLDDNHITFARIDFRDKESHKDEYGLVQALMDLRMLHIVSSSLSDKHAAGRRSEVYLLDLSQYSGSRLKQKIKVLDLERGRLVLKETRSSTRPKHAETARALIDLLREGPEFPLDSLSMKPRKASAGAQG